MNFCGAEYDVHLDNAITTQVTSATLCGREACVKEDENLGSLFTDDDEDEEIAAGKDLGALDSSGSGNRKDGPDQPPLWQIIPKRRGESKTDHVADTSGRHRSMIDPGRYRLSTPTPPSASQRNETMTSSTPSPMDLNPMSPDVWQQIAQKDKAPCPSVGAAMGSGNIRATTANVRSSLLCPSLKPSTGRTSTTDKLSERLQRGFRVAWCQNIDSSPEMLTPPGKAVARPGKKVSSFLYLEADQRSLCLRVDEGRGPSVTSTHRLCCRLPIDKILRMEIGGRESSGAPPQRCFSIIANQDSKICYYDFEAGSPIERELIVSTLLVVLDRKAKLNATAEGDDVDNAVEGSEDQPIPCSPSLEQRVQDCFREDAEEIKSVINLDEIQTTLEKKERWNRRLPLPGRLLQRRIESYRSRSSSPKAGREKIFRQASEGYGTKSRPIDTIHGTPFLRSRLRQTTQDVLVSPMTSPEVLSADLADEESIHVPASLAPDRARQRNTQPSSELAAQPTVEDLIVEFASSGHLSPWCADDACTLALKDFANSCSNIFASGGPSYSNSICYMPGGLHEQQRMLEEYIESAIGAPSAFYSFLTEGQDWRPSAKNQAESTRASAKTRFRNRATVLNAQARRIRRLKGEMTFSAALQKSQETLPYVQTSRSFNDEAFSKRRARVAEEGASAFHSSVLFQHVVGSATTKLDPLPDEELVYYDSDPEDSRSQSLYRKCPRQVQAQLKNKSEGAVQLASPPAPTGDTGFSKVKSTRRVSKKLEEDVLVQIVQTMTNDRMTLIWHPTKAHEVTNKSPLCVRVWIESGVCLLDGTFVMPKLSWTQVLDASTSDAEAKPGRRLPSAEPHCLDLLDICRVYGVDSVDRARHPFADTRKSFMVETLSESFLFEALSAEERDRIVYGLKLVIARLASMLMLRDARAAEEFFGAIAPSVPGEAPAWVQGSKHGLRLPTVPDE